MDWIGLWNFRQSRARNGSQYAYCINSKSSYTLARLLRPPFFVGVRVHLASCPPPRFCCFASKSFSSIKSWTATLMTRVRSYIQKNGFSHKSVLKINIDMERLREDFSKWRHRLFNQDKQSELITLSWYKKQHYFRGLIIFALIMITISIRLL